MVEVKEKSKYITTSWKDLQKTADELGVPVSTIVFVKEYLKTNKRDEVVNYINKGKVDRKGYKEPNTKEGWNNRPLAPDEAIPINRANIKNAVTNGNKAGDTIKEATNKTAESLKVALARTIEPIIVTIKTGNWLFEREYKLRVSLIDGNIMVQEQYLNPVTGRQEWDKANEVTTISLKALEENLTRRKLILGY